MAIYFFFGLSLRSFEVIRPAKGEHAGGGEYLGPRLVRRGGGRNLGKTSSHGCVHQEGWGPIMCNHLLVLGPDPGSHQPCEVIVIL